MAGTQYCFFISSSRHLGPKLTNTKPVAYATITWDGALEEVPVDNPKNMCYPNNPPVSSAHLYQFFSSEERRIGWKSSSQTEFFPHENAEKSLGQGFGVWRGTGHASAQENLPSSSGWEIKSRPSSSHQLPIFRSFIFQRSQQGGLWTSRDNHVISHCL